MLVLTLLVIGIAFYRSSRDPVFRMQGFPTSLSKDVVASVSGYERTEFDNGVRKYYVKADRATTFADNHQELENAYFEIFEPSGAGSDRITAVKAVYIPEENKNFTAYLAGDVRVETRDRLKVQTELVTYRRADETATADEAVAFQRDNLSGTSFGAAIRIADKQIELLRDVAIGRYDTSEFAGQPDSRMNSGHALYDQLHETIKLEQGVKVHSVSEPGGRITDLSGRSSVVSLVETAEDRRDIKTAELFTDVAIDSASQGSTTQIRSSYAMFEKAADKFVLRENVKIVSPSDATTTTITAGNAVFERAKGTIDLSGNAEITQGNNLAKGNSIFAELYPSQKLKTAVIRENGYIRQTEADRTIEVTAAELNASFADGQALTSANAVNSANAVLTPANPTEYTKVTMTAPRSIGLRFKTAGILDKMITDGRTTIRLDVPDNAPDSANKRLVADKVTTTFSGDGKSIVSASAAGNAELHVEPLKASAENYRTVVNAPRFECEFFPSGNNAKKCVGESGTTTVRYPTVADKARGEQTLKAATLTADFSPGSRDIERLEAAGNAKFTELDRTGIADRMTFLNATRVVQLRGGEPTVWDSRARARAEQIDWDTNNNRSVLRGSVSTTYYSQGSTGGAAPFSDPKKPVFVTSDTAEIDHRAEVAVYTGNARGWQDKSYVRAAKFTIQQGAGRFDAVGGVQSVLYDVNRRESGQDSKVPVSASAGSMTYLRDERLLRYLSSVDIRQGTDRITGEKADVYLNENNEIARSEIETNVVITQPKRRATGSYASYNAAGEVVVLRGSPARVEDAVNGQSEAGQMTLYLRENRVKTEGRSTGNTAGRSRSVYKVTEN